MPPGDSASVGEGCNEYVIDVRIPLKAIQNWINTFIDERGRSYLNADHGSRALLLWCVRRPGGVHPENGCTESGLHELASVHLEVLRSRAVVQTIDSGCPI